MKVRASVKRSPECKIVRRKGRLYVINKRILDLNKDKDSYGKNSRVDIPK
jgi:ribosomal protein L36